MLNPLDLTGRRILVTGASSGIGRGTAIVLSQLGAKLLLVARNRERLEQTLAALEGDGHDLEARDLSDTESLPAWMKSAAAAGPFHGVVHAAGLVINRPLRVLTPQNVDELSRINVTAALMLAKGLRQKGVAAASSSIVLISSIAALKGQPTLAAYAGTKGALISIAKTLAVELARDGIRINCVCPGIVRTETTSNLEQILSEDAYREIEATYPLGVGNVSDVAYAIAFFLADSARWITGDALVLDGGYSA